MFSKRDRTTSEYSTAPAARVIRARGGVSFFAIFSGVIVAIGAFFLLSAIVGGILAASNVDPQDLTGVDAGIGAGLALIGAFFIAYLWGGYTAGRMSRGAGFLNGLLVPIVAILLGVIVGAIVYALGATANLNIPFSNNRLPIEDTYVIDWTIGLGAGALAAMFLGGIIGGLLGARWHTKLERRTEDLAEERSLQDSRRVDADRTREVDVTEGARSYDGSTYPGEHAPTAPVIQHHPSVAGPTAPAAAPPPPPAQPDVRTQPGSPA